MKEKEEEKEMEGGKEGMREEGTVTLDTGCWAGVGIPEGQFEGS